MSSNGRVARRSSTAVWVTDQAAVWTPSGVRERNWATGIRRVRNGSPYIGGLLGFVDELLELGDGLGLEAGFDDAAVGVEKDPVGVSLVPPRLGAVGAEPCAIAVDDDGKGEVVMVGDPSRLGWPALEVDPDNRELLFGLSIDALEGREDIAGGIGAPVR